MSKTLTLHLIALTVLFTTIGTTSSHAQTNNVNYNVTADIVYGHKDGMALTMDLFEPKSNAKGIGLMFMVSGGWVSAWHPPEQHAAMFQPMLSSGYSVIAVRHGSSPKYVIPEIVADVRLAHKYVHEHADQLHIDPKRLGVFGFSAGGHLSLMLGTTANDSKSDEAPRIAAVAAVFPPTDLVPYVIEGNPRREQFPALKFDPKKSEAYSPLLQVTSPDAPTVLIHGDKDDLVPLWHSEKIHDAFEKANVPSELVVIEGAGHGFDDKGSKRMVATIMAWFDKHLASIQK